MKNMIRFLRSQHIKLICLNIACLISFSVYSENPINENNSTTENNISEILNHKTYNLKNVLRQYSDTSSYIIVLKNYRYCNDCFSTVNFFLLKNKTELKAVYEVISLTDSSSLDRKKSLSSGKSLLPDADEFSFQYENSENLFSLLNVRYTPEIIILNKGKITHIPYKDIFDDDNNLAVETQFKIAELLK